MFSIGIEGQVLSLGRRTIQLLERIHRVVPPAALVKKQNQKEEVAVDKNITEETTPTT